MAGAEDDRFKTLLELAKATDLTAPAVEPEARSIPGADRFGQHMYARLYMTTEYIRYMGMFRKAPASEAREGGHNILGVRWVDVEKADGTHRSRLVAQEIRSCNAAESSATTPPIESLKYVLRRVARHAQSILHVDATHVLLRWHSRRRTHVRLPDEGQETPKHDMCGKLVKAAYGAHDAARNRQRTRSGVRRDRPMTADRWPATTDHGEDRPPATDDRRHDQRPMTTGDR